MHHRTIAFFVIFLSLTAASLESFGFGNETPPATRLQTRYSGLSAPIYLTHADDGTKRVFIVERAGIIKVVQPGSNTPTVFLNITSLTTTSGERGLLSMAFHPNYEVNRRFYVYFTRASDGAIQISQFETSPTNPNVALTTEHPILTVLHPGQSNHNGGTLNFGDDGHLYIATGDGGGQNDPNNNAQNIDSLLGKMLRINVDGATGYTIPATNPFAGPTPGADEIFAYGLRNPFRWSFDDEGSNQIWLGDVGQNSWEEVNNITIGGNYGWRIMEGNGCTSTIDPNCTPPTGHILPVFVYSSQNTTSRCSITGGYVYRGERKTLPDGSYIYGDYCTGEILLWHNGQQVPLHDISDFNLVSFGEDEDGELYVIQAGAGIIQKIVPAKSNADFTGDFRTDLSIFRPSNATYYILDVMTGTTRIESAAATPRLPAAEDYDGDRRTDVGFFHAPSGTWEHDSLSSLPGGVSGWGEVGDIQLPGDYDGDGRADFALWRPSNGTWYIMRATGYSSIRQWGEPNDIPISADFDGDGRLDMAVWRPSNGNWYTIFSTNDSIQVNTYGLPDDIPATGDFDNDGRNDLALFRPSTGIWYIKNSSNNSFQTASWGVDGDIPVVGDYDADGRDDIAVWRPSTGTWFIVRSSGGILRVNGWGIAGDVPVPSGDAP
ncbi:MAG: PQQ-dependent sugar dehydrogenase [Pyrinomonadaceae bacterium]